MRAPSLREYPVSPRLGKSIFGHKCEPTRMKQEGTSAMGKQRKMAPAPFSGRRWCKARVLRDKLKFAGRSRLPEREAYQQILDFLVNREFTDLAPFVADVDAARQMLRAQYNGQARRLSGRGYRIENGNLVRPRQ